MERGVEDGLIAGAVAAAMSGLPSTAWALVTGEDPLEATLAAGSIVLPRERRRAWLLAAAVPLHVAISLGWGVVLARMLPRGREISVGPLAGLAIAALDLGLVGRLFPRVKTLPLVPQLADHVLYGATVGFVLARRREPLGS